MGIENATWANELDETLPLGSDTKDQGDNHLRLIKQVIKNSLGATQGLATQAEAQAQASISNTKLMTPLRGYEAVTARLISQGDAEAATDNLKIMTALRTKQQIDARLATQAEAEGGADATKIMTSLRGKQQIDARLASQAEAEAGTDNTKLITPLRSQQSGVAVFNAQWNAKRASQAEAEAGTTNDKAMTPLRSRQHGDLRYLLLGQTTAFTRTVLDDHDAATVRGTLGLSSAATASISSSIGSTSTTVLANSAAAKAAYDRGSAALTEANNAKSETQEAFGAHNAYVLAIATTTVNAGATVSGASLRAVGLNLVYNGSSGPGEPVSWSPTVSIGSSLSGTWRNMGNTISGSSTASGSGSKFMSLFIRVT